VTFVRRREPITRQALRALGDDLTVDRPRSSLADGTDPEHLPRRQRLPDGLGLQRLTNRLSGCYVPVRRQLAIAEADAKFGGRVAVVPGFPGTWRPSGRHTTPDEFFAVIVNVEVAASLVTYTLGSLAVSGDVAGLATGGGAGVSVAFGVEAGALPQAVATASVAGRRTSRR
jgi:hypothetical protein